MVRAGVLRPRETTDDFGCGNPSDRLRQNNRNRPTFPQILLGSTLLMQSEKALLVGLYRELLVRDW